MVLHAKHVKIKKLNITDSKTTLHVHKNGGEGK